MSTKKNFTEYSSFLSWRRVYFSTAECKGSTEVSSLNIGRQAFIMAAISDTSCSFLPVKNLLKQNRILQMA